MLRLTVAGALLVLGILVAWPAYADATSDVLSAMMKFGALSSYEISYGNGGFSGTIDIVKPNAMHMQAAGMEMIRIGAATYTKVGRDWQKIPEKYAGGDPSKMTDQVRTYASKTDFTATDLGMKTINGESLHGYKVQDSKSNTSMIWWVGSDGLPHAWETGSGDLMRVGKFNAVDPIKAPI